MKKMISEIKINERVRTVLGVRRAHYKISRNGDGYLEFEFYDISGRMKGYLFGETAKSEEIRRCLYAEVTAMPKLHKGSLILR